MATETAADAPWQEMLPSELRKLRTLATKAGYVSPFPAKGKAPVTTIEDRCPGCRKTLFVNLQGEVKCPYERCTEHGIVQSPVAEEAQP